MNRKALTRGIILISVTIVLLVLAELYGTIPHLGRLPLPTPMTPSVYLPINWWPWITHSAGVFTLCIASILRIRAGRIDAAQRFAYGALAMASLLFSVMLWVGYSLELTDQNM